MFFFPTIHLSLAAHSTSSVRHLVFLGAVPLPFCASSYSLISCIVLHHLLLVLLESCIELTYEVKLKCRLCLSCYLQVLAQAIRFHPKVPGLWIYAAAWEFDLNLNVAAARALMQSGLRSCPESEDMWIEYLRMELTYLNKLKARKVALGEDVKTLQKSDDDAGQWKEENKELFMPLNEQDKGPDGSRSAGDALREKEDMFWRQGLLIIRTIYNGAMEALPSSLSLRKKFLEILNSVDLAHSEEMKIEVLDDLKKDFSHCEDYWDWFARLQLTDLNKLNGKDALSNKLNKSIQVISLHLILCF